MQIEGSVALVTGASRGLGRVFARELVRRGAARVYGAARDPAAVTEPGVVPVALDITDAARVAQVARECADVSLLVNNAGVMAASSFIGSVTSFFTNPFNASYGASKAAGLALANGVRIELHHQGTQVVAVHAGFVDTDMSAGLDVPKISPESVVSQALDAVEAGRLEVLADERSRQVKASLPRDHELIYPAIQALWEGIPAPGEA
jgi:NAD(P)-dependent dehydrogenase (short-subunit alcohol dehydrogenase family)